MTEAFEIGVSLALQDGVSDAIGKARRDVAALEHAVRESGLSLRALREVGARSASVAFGEQRKAVAEAPAKRVVPEAAPRAETEVPLRLEAREAPPRAAAVPAMEVIAPPLVKAAAPRAEPDETPRIETEASPGPVENAGAWSAPVALQEAAQSRAGDWAESMALTPRLDAPANQSAAQAPEVMPAHVPVQRFVDAPLAAVPSEAMKRVSAPFDFGAQEDIRPAAPSESASVERQAAAPLIVSQAQPQVQLGTVPDAAHAAAPAMVVAEAARGAPPPPRELVAVIRNSEKESTGQMTLLSALRLSGGFTVATQNEDHSNGSAGDEVVAAFQDTAMQAAPLEAAPAVMNPGRAPVAGIASPAAKAKTIEQAEGQDTRPQEGDVFLDGMLVGRWMSRFLNREAERASAGPTGFDSRRSRLLPGVTVGG